MTTYADKTLGEIVTGQFQAAAVFEKYQLDFCCGGKRTLADACQKKNINLKEVETALDAIHNSPEKGMDFKRMSPDMLISYILIQHHFYIEQNMPVIRQHLEKVAFKHGEAFPYMKEVARLFSLLETELMQHMKKEEQVLFPAIRSMQVPGAAVPANTLLMPIRVMEAEHDIAGGIMEQIHTLTNNYAVPEEACTTFRICLSELKEFETKLHEHVHLENNLLFPVVLSAYHHTERMN